MRNGKDLLELPTEVNIERHSQFLQNAISGFSLKIQLTRDYKDLQGAYKGYMGLQGFPRDYKGFSTGVYKGLQSLKGFTRVYRNIIVKSYTKYYCPRAFPSSNTHTPLPMMQLQ